MKTILISFFLLVASRSFSKATEHSYDWSEKKISCVNNYIKNPYFKSVIKDLYSDKNYPFIKEMISYCDCESKIERSQGKDWIAKAYQDKTKLLEEKDHCANEIYSSSQNLRLHFQTKYVELFIPEIEDKIEDRYSTGFKQQSGKEKWFNFSKCTQEKITKICSKTNSLSYTYNCIKNQGKTNNMEKNYRQCKFNLLDETLDLSGESLYSI